MKIAYIGGAYVPSRGADSMHHMAICEAMADNGHDVTLHVRPGPENAADDFEFYGVKRNFKLVKHPRPQVRGWGAFVYAAYVGRHVRSHSPPDLLYARERYGLMLSVGAGIPFVFESHWKPSYAKQRQEAWLFRRRNFRRLVVISEGLRRIYRKLFPWLSEAQIVVAHDAANPAASAAPARLALPGARLQVGYVGGMLPGYGIEVLVGIGAASPAIDVHVVGGKEAQVREWRAKARAVPNVTFHGFVPPRDLPLYYARFDLVLAPFQKSASSLAWMSPMKLFEYMAHGKAIICSDFPILREVLTDDVTGLFVQAEDVNAWTAAIARLNDVELRQRLGRAGLAHLTSQHTWQRRAEVVLDGLSAG